MSEYMLVEYVKDNCYMQDFILTAITDADKQT